MFGCTKAILKQRRISSGSLFGFSLQNGRPLFPFTVLILSPNFCSIWTSLNWNLSRKPPPWTFSRSPGRILSYNFDLGQFSRYLTTDLNYISVLRFETLRLVMARGTEFRLLASETFCPVLARTLDKEHQPTTTAVL